METNPAVIINNLKNIKALRLYVIDKSIKIQNYPTPPEFIDQIFTHENPEFKKGLLLHHISSGILKDVKTKICKIKKRLCWI